MEAGSELFVLATSGFMKPVFPSVASRIAAGIALGFLLAGSAHAQTVTKANNNDALNLGSSYVGGAAPTSSDTIVFNNNITSNRSLNAAGIAVNGLDFQSTLSSSSIIVTFASGTLTLGAGGLTKNDTSARTVIGTAFALSANQVWNINSSILQFSATGSLTTGSNTVTMQGNGTLQFSGSTTTLGSNVTIGSVGTIQVTATSSPTFQGSNTFDSLQIIGNSSLTGATIGNFGVASAFGDGGTSTAITLGQFGGQTGTLIYSGTSASSNRAFTRFSPNTSVGWTGGIEVSSPGETLTLSGVFANSAGSGNAFDGGWRFGGAGNLSIQSIIPAQVGDGVTNVIKNGAGTLRLSGNNTYEGLTTLSAGSLLVIGQSGSNSGTGTGNVSVAALGTLGGTGRIAGLTDVSGAVSPGDGGLGTLTVNNSLTWNGGVNWLFDLGAANASDLLNLTSGNFTKGSGSSWTFDFGGSTQQGTFNLVTWSGSTTFSAGDFSSTNLGGGNTGSFQIDGNILKFVAVPEPGVVGLLGAAAAGWLALRRRSR
jgi:fibronectin-binding autotransporter adhesin